MTTKSDAGGAVPTRADAQSARELAREIVAALVSERKVGLTPKNQSWLIERIAAISDSPAPVDAEGDMDELHFEIVFPRNLPRDTITTAVLERLEPLQLEVIIDERAQSAYDSEPTAAPVTTEETRRKVWGAAIQIAKAEAFERRMAFNVYDALIAARELESPDGAAEKEKRNG